MANIVVCYHYAKPPTVMMMTTTTMTMMMMIDDVDDGRHPHENVALIVVMCQSITPGISDEEVAGQFALPTHDDAPHNTSMHTRYEDNCVDCGRATVTKAGDRQLMTGDGYRTRFHYIHTMTTAGPMPTV